MAKTEMDVKAFNDEVYVMLRRKKNENELKDSVENRMLSFIHFGSLITLVMVYINHTR